MLHANQFGRYCGHCNGNGRRFTSKWEREKNAISRCLSKKYGYKWNRICEPTKETERKTKAYALLWWKSNWANNCQFGLENYVKHSLKCDNIGSSKCLSMYRAVKILSTTCTFGYLSSIFLDYSHWSDWKAHKVLHLLNTNLNLRNVHKQVSKNFCGRWLFLPARIVSI